MSPAIQTSFVRHLSIASAEAITPLPVYGIFSVSSAPCTVPASPKRPCSAMNARAKPSRFSSSRSRSAGSKGWGAMPSSRSAFSTALPERKEISRSDDGPPSSTATLPNSLIALPRDSACSSPLSDDVYLGLEVDAGRCRDAGAHVLDQRLDVGCTGAAVGIDDEVCVLVG